MTICDRCKKANAFSVTVSVAKVNFTIFTRVMDFCDECLVELKETLSQPFEEAVENK